MNRMPRGALLFGTLSGLAIAGIDNLAAGGEVSPIAIVALLLAATAVAGARWSWSGWVGAIATWALVPGVHLAKHALGWADTLAPNTYGSILRLGLFTAAVSAAGFCGGVVLATAIAEPPSRR